MLKLDNSYQKIPLPDGSIIDGLFPTDVWYQSFASKIPIKNKTILDLGCCTGSYGIQAITDECKFYQGVEQEWKRLSQCNEVLTILPTMYRDKMFNLHVKIEDFYPRIQHDIVIFSMVIHHLIDPQKHIPRFVKCANEHIIFIYRYPRDIEEQGWRPTLNELNKVVGMQPFYDDFISETPEQNIKLVIYRK